MARKKKRAVEQYTYLSVRVDEYSAHVSASLNHEACDPRQYNDKVRIYQFGSTLEIQGICTYPDDRMNEKYRITVHGQQSGEGNLDARLADYHIRDEDGLPKYRKLRGQSVPVYDIPNGLGLLQKERGTRDWNGWIWVPEQTVAQMLTLIATIRPLYVRIDERKIERTHWIRGLTLQTTDPADE